MNKSEIVETIIRESGYVNREYKDSLERALLKKLEKKNKFFYLNIMIKSIYILLTVLVLVGGGYLIYKNVIEDKGEKIESNTDNNSNTNNMGIANPASTYCIDNGGELKLEDSIGNCYFDDGSMCEEWAFFNGECKKGDSLK